MLTYALALVTLYSWFSNLAGKMTQANWILENIFIILHVFIILHRIRHSPYDPVGSERLRPAIEHLVRVLWQEMQYVSPRYRNLDRLESDTLRLWVRGVVFNLDANLQHFYEPKFQTSHKNSIYRKGYIRVVTESQVNLSCIVLTRVESES